MVWCSTTPVATSARNRLLEDVVRYNEAAVSIVGERGIPIHDVFSFAFARLDQEVISKDGVHFTPSGASMLAEQVAQVIEETLRRRPNQ